MVEEVEELVEEKPDESEWGNSFIQLGREISERFWAPFGQVSFWVALVFGVILFGALGIWVELYKELNHSSGHYENLRTAIHTFFPALAFTSTMQLIWRRILA